MEEVEGHRQAYSYRYRGIDFDANEPQGCRTLKHRMQRVARHNPTIRPNSKQNPMAVHHDRFQGRLHLVQRGR